MSEAIPRIEPRTEYTTEYASGMTTRIKLLVAVATVTMTTGCSVTVEEHGPAAPRPVTSNLHVADASFEPGLPVTVYMTVESLAATADPAIGQNHPAARNAGGIRGTVEWFDEAWVMLTLENERELLVRREAILAVELRSEDRE